MSAYIVRPQTHNYFVSLYIVVKFTYICISFTAISITCSTLLNERPETDALMRFSQKSSRRLPFEAPKQNMTNATVLISYLSLLVRFVPTNFDPQLSHVHNSYCRVSLVLLCTIHNYVSCGHFFFTLKPIRWKEFHMAPPLKKNLNPG